MIRIGIRSASALLIFGVAVHAAGARFAEHLVAGGLKGGYQVVIADVNHDGKPDLIALASGMSELVWFENPGWQRHVIAGGFKGMINCAALDLDGDGIPEIVLASGFVGPGVSAANGNTGILTLLEHQGDPRQPWKATEIDRLPASHRLRWADVNGSGKPVLIDVPLTAADAAPPDFRSDVPLAMYRPGEWKRILIGDEEEGVVHGVFVTDWNGNGRGSLLIAGFLGIHLYELPPHGAWTRRPIARGDPAPWPKCGASDIAAGHVGKQRFIASIEPWHGNQVAVYRESDAWRRHVIDESLVDGHTVLAVPLDGNGNDTIVAGYRGQGQSVYLYSPADSQGAQWTRRVLDDGGMSAAACAAADLNADGRLDIACVGSGTANLKWYENLGTGEGP